jgi:hypothetical protein
MSEPPSSYEIQTREVGFVLPSSPTGRWDADRIAGIETKSEPGEPLRVRVFFGDAAEVAEVRERMRQRMIAVGIYV